jgi:hypothetical protein
MAKSDLLAWIRAHEPPLVGTTFTSETKCALGNLCENDGKTDYERFNAVANADEALATLRSRQPPLTVDQVTEAMVEYNK